MNDTASRIRAACAGTIFDGEVHHYESIDSTNRIAMERGRAGFSGEVFLADEQTAGRGRGGHSWHSRRGDGLYLTVLCQPKVAASEVLKISFAAGLAARETIQNETGIAIDIRWPNDLIVAESSGRKVGGILTESALHPDGVLSFCAIGIGINLNHVSMPDELAAISTSLRQVNGGDVDRDTFAAVLLRNLSSAITNLEYDSENTVCEFAAASTWVRGKRVSVAEDGGYTGVTDGLSATGLLRVRCDDGTVREVRHGGVRTA